MIYRTEPITLTAAAGSVTGYLDKTHGVNQGEIISIIYTKDDFDNGVVFTITLDETGVGLWTETAVNASKIVYPSSLIQDQVGVDTALRTRIPFSGERIKFVITLAGTAKSGSFEVVYDDGF